MSYYGVVNCLNCCAPSLPNLVVAQGDLSDAPMVEVGRTRQVVCGAGDDVATGR